MIVLHKGLERWMLEIVQRSFLPFLFCPFPILQRHEHWHHNSKRTLKQFICSYYWGLLVYIIGLYYWDFDNF